MHSADPFVAALETWVEAFMRRSMRHFMRYSRESGLSMSQVGALFHIHREGNCGVSDLGDNLGVSSAAASQMLERLVQQGLILRSEAPNDRRAKQLVLTEKGRQVVQESIHARQGWLNDLAAMLSAEEKAQVIAALGILLEKINRLEETADSK